MVKYSHLMPPLRFYLNLCDISYHDSKRIHRLKFLRRFLGLKTIGGFYEDLEYIQSVKLKEDIENGINNTMELFS